MSFILDALKKSDSKRQESSPPRLDTVHHSVPQTGRRRPLWIGLLLALLVLNVGLLVWFFAVDRQAPAIAISTVQPQPTPQTVAPAAVAPSPLQPQTAEPPLPQRVVPKQSSLAASPAANRPLRDRRIYTISELPAAVQRRIPELHMSLHAYNKTSPAAGMVRVNAQILRAGAKLDGKYLLEEINADGAVFRFDGYRFLLPRN